MSNNASSKKKKIFGFVNQKGGVGKSTGARNTHIKDVYNGINSVLLDCDNSQHSCVEFNNRREFFINKGIIDVPKLNVVKMDHKDLREGIVDYAKRYDRIILDPGGRVDKETELAIAISDVLVMWLKYGQDEMDTLKTMHRLFSDSKNSSIPAFVIPNEISTNYLVKPTQLKKMKEAISSRAPFFQMTENYISRRDAYQISREEGLAIFELKGAHKSRAAVLEFNNYYDEVFNG